MRPMHHDCAQLRSADGTAISYRRFGEGPAVILLHGGMQSAQSFTSLASRLGKFFSVFVPDRRGRGKSGPFGAHYGLATERADVTALVHEVGAQRLFALSSGALIALDAARTLPQLRKLAVYEPPLKGGALDPTAWSARCEQEIEHGDLASAMVTVLKGSGDTSALSFVPRFVLTPLFRAAINLQARQATGDEIALRDLIPTMRGDAVLAREAESGLADLTDIQAEVLLLGGSRSAPALRAALDLVASRLPTAKRIEMRGAGHLAADDGGRPGDVAEILRTFFG